MKQTISAERLLAIPPPVREFLRDKNVLIVDSSKNFSHVMQRAFIEMGVKLDQIRIAYDDRSARMFLSRRPDVIVSEFKVGPTEGLGYAALQGEYQPQRQKRIFLMVTGGAHENVVAESVEEEIDGYLLKPFSSQQFVERILQIVDEKLKPSRYAQALETVKYLLRLGEADKAKSLALAAAEMDGRTPAVYAHLGEAHLLAGEYREALAAFEAGLALNPRHYRCLRKKIETYLAQDQKLLAYRSLRLFLEVFPMNPDVLARAFALCVATRSLDDMAEYYEAYKEQEQRSPELKEVVYETFFEAAEIAIKDEDLARAKEFFTCGIAASGRHEESVERAVRRLNEKACFELAQEIFSMYPKDRVGSDHYRSVEFLISKNSLPPDQIVERGRQVIHSGKVTPEVYLEVIHQLAKMQKDKAADSVVYEAIRKFPDKKAEFERALKFSA